MDNDAMIRAERIAKQLADAKAERDKATEQKKKKEEDQK